jgi:photosynthetic reaction center cytochrome c subunit
MKPNILRLLVVTLACTCAAMLISSARAQKSAPRATLNREFAASLSSLGMAVPEQTPAPPTAPAAQEKTVDQTRKNIKVLTGLPDSQLIPVMNFFAASLGVRCNHCHVNKNGQWDYPADDKEEKQTARVMIKMVLDINKTTFRGNTEVGCYTCHRGRTSPIGFPSLPLPLPTPRPRPPATPAPGQAAATPAPTPAGPTADQILAKYLDALGGLAAIDKLKTVVMKGTYTGANGEALSYEIYMTAPDKFDIIVTTQQGTIERGFDGKVGWEKEPRGVTELAAGVLAGLKEKFLFYSNIKLKEQFTQLRVGRRDKIGDRDVVVLNGRTADNRREQLYFDAQTGLLLRRIRYMPTMIGVIPEQTDFDDYRDVEGIKFPFTVKVAAVEVGNPIATRKYTEIKPNAPVDDSKFKMPAAPAKPASP